jgi:hypothetical protein
MTPNQIEKRSRAILAEISGPHDDRREPNELEPVSPEELARIIDRELAACPGELRAYFQSVAFEPTKWSQAPHGNMGGGFWAIAVDQNRVLWYNDIEDGFNVSVFPSPEP